MADEINTLRAQKAELEKEAMILRGTVEAVTTQRQQAEQRNAELVAALREVDEIVNDANHSAEDRLCAAANRLLNTRAESAPPDAAECASDYTSQLTEDKRNESAERMAGIQSLAKPATPAKLCKHCGGAGVIHDTDIDGNITGYCDCPKCSATPAKHPDTEIVDWLDAQFQGGDDWCRLFPLGNTIREAYAARKQEASK